MAVVTPTFLPAFEKDMALAARQFKAHREAMDISNSDGPVSSKLKRIFEMFWDNAQRRNRKADFDNLEYFLNKIVQQDARLAAQMAEIKRTVDQARRRKLLHDLLMDDELNRMCSEKIKTDLDLIKKQEQQDEHNNRAMKLLKDAGERSQSRANQAAYNLAGEVGVAIGQLINYMLEDSIGRYLQASGRDPSILFGDSNDVANNNRGCWDPKLMRNFPDTVGVGG